MITNTIVVALHSHVNNPAINANAKAISKNTMNFWKNIATSLFGMITCMIFVNQSGDFSITAIGSSPYA